MKHEVIPRIAIEPELIPLADFKPHPRNYRQHPDDQIEHLMQSLEEHGFYRPIVVTRDTTILAGHGVYLAAQRMGLSEAPAIRLDLDPESPLALKVLTGDNEISHLVESDDRLLSEILKEISQDDDLLGTGYDDMMLANLVYVTRPESEIKDFDHAAHWVGMPEYDEGGNVVKLVVSFRNTEDRHAFLQLVNLDLPDSQKSTWWPPKEREDPGSLRFEG